MITAVKEKKPPEARIRPRRGKLSRAAKARNLRAVREAAPYAASLIACAAFAFAVHRLWAIVPAAGVVAGVAGARLHDHYGWHRAGGKAAMRKRRRYQGTATRRELRRKLSPEAAAKKAGPPVLIGRAKGQDIAGSREDSYLLVAPPRSGKTGLLACWAADAPGPLLVTSTRTDLYAHTAIPRGGSGDIWVLNPDGDGGIPSGLQWSPVDGCEDPAVAMQRAGYLMDAAPHDKSGKDSWWDHQSKTLLQYLLHAAALLPGATMLDVRSWAAGVMGDPAPLRALARSTAAPGWGNDLAVMAERIGIDEQYGGAVCTGVMTALAWLSDPGMAEAACPVPGAGFDAAAFLGDGTGTVYLIGADRPHGSLAPYFACFAANLFETAKRTASRSPRGRLAAPLALALDEAAITCPVPLHRWTSEAGGHGVTVMAVVQGMSQLHRWGEAEARTIVKNSTVKVFWGGDTDAADLEAISAVCGEQDTWDHVTGPDGSRTKHPRMERAVPPERIRMLGDGEVLVLHRNTRPVFARVTPVWDRRGYEPCTAPPPPAAAMELPAIDPPRREPIAPPYRPPVIAGQAIPDYAPDLSEEAAHGTPARL